MTRYNLGRHFFSDTFKTYWKYLLFVTLTLAVFEFIRLRTSHKSRVVITAIINAPAGAFHPGYVPQVNGSLKNTLGNRADIITNLKFIIIPGTANYKLTFTATKLNASRAHILTVLNKHIQLLITDNAKRIDKLADSLLFLQEKFESLDSIRNSFRQQLPLKTIATITLSPASVKSLRVLDYLEAYLSRPPGSFTLIPEGLYTSGQDIELQINDFNNLQYRRQMLLGPESRDKRAIAENNDKLSASRDKLSFAIASERDKLKGGTTTTYRNNAAADTNSINKVSTEINQTSSQVIAFKNRINVKENQNRAFSKPVSYVAYHETTIQKKPLSLWYIFTGLILLLIPFLISFWKNLTSENRKLITVKSVIGNSRLPALVLPANNPLRDEAIKNFSKKLIPTLDHLVKKNLSVRVVLITDNGYKNLTSFCLQFAAELTAANKRVLIIDYDIEQPQLLETLGIPYTHGLRTYLDSEKQIVPGIITTSARYNNISFVGAGPVINSDSKDVLSFLDFLENNWSAEENDLDAGDTLDKKLIELIAYYNYSFNYILVTVPQLELLTRNSELHKLADMKIYLIKQEKNELITTEF